MPPGTVKKPRSRVKKRSQKSQNRARTVVLRILISAIALVLLVFGIFGFALLLVVRQPGEYEPRYLSQQEKVWADEQGCKKIEQLFNQSQVEEKFTLTIEQQLVNALLLMDDLEPWGYQRNFPGVAKHFQDAQVVFKNERIYLMGRVTYEGVNTVMTITLAPKMTDDGKLRISLDSLKAGVLKIPAGVVKQQLEKLLETMKLPLIQENTDGVNNRYSINGKELSESLGVMKLVLNPEAEITMDSVFRATDDRQIRIEDIKIGKGVMEVEIQPMGYDK